MTLVAPPRHLDWSTPQAIVDELAEAYGPFTFDPAAEHATAKAPLYYTPERGEDGLALHWPCGPGWLNPPYGRHTSAWLDKAAAEVRESGMRVVSLIKAATDTAWWSRCVVECGQARELLFVKGRIRFEHPDEPNAPAKFPSAVVVYGPGHRPLVVRWWWPRCHGGPGITWTTPNRGYQEALL